jgi:protein JSN1
MATPYIPTMDMLRQSNRIRSYSVNNKDVHADEYPDEEFDADGMPVDSQYVAALQDQLAATNAAIRSHNLAVQAFVNQASSTRRRAQTAGVLDAPGSHLMNSYLSTKAGAVPSPLSQTGLRLQNEQKFDELPQALAGLNLNRSNSRNAGLLSAEEQGLEGPTSALWLGNIPTSTTTSTLVEMFKPHGPIVSVRVLTHKNCGFVNFERVESAISAKASMNGKEIFPGASPIRINFAKPASPANTPGHDGAYPSPSPDPFAKGQESSQGASATAASDVAPASTAGNAAPTLPPLRELMADVLDIVQQFGASEDDAKRISASVQSAVQFNAFVDEIPTIREPSHTRVHDAPKLRDIRKRIDNQSLSQSEIENIALDMIPEIAELSSDYLGNTVVQKLFEHCSDQLRDMMLAEIAPHIAEIGVHKNGTWAAQKIIDVCKTPQQMSLIVENIRPYTVPLFLDQYGNYVLQGCLKFGAPFDNYIFETMLSRMWQVSQGRFGARAMRACLESHHATKEQQKMLAATIALHSVQLATNQNGALLLTWYLDTCTFPQRRTVLAPRLVPHLVHLCTHKVAYLTVLKVINQKAEPEARDTILTALFFTPNDQVLEAILSDQNCGATLIFKVLTTPFFDENIRSQVVENVKNVLVRIKAQPNQGYKRLMDEVGLSTRNSGSSREPSTAPESRQRPSSRQANLNGSQSQQGNSGKQHFNNLNAAANQSGYDVGYGQQRGEAQDPNMSAFPAFNMGMMYNGANNSIPPAMNLQQMQYQQNMLGRGAQQVGYGFSSMQAGYGPYTNGGPGVEQYRQANMPNGSPIQPPSMPPGNASQPQFAPPPGFGGMGGGYGYSNMGGMQNVNYGQEQGNRRGRVRGYV